MAARYALWIRNQMDRGYWEEAHAALERASDFADVSSDISYLLALTRSNGGSPRTSVLEALEMALVTDRWNMYSGEDARLLKIENLIALKLYSEALHELSKADKSIREAVLTLKALVNFRPEEFPGSMTETLDRYPRESEPVRIFLNYIKNESAVFSPESGRNPGTVDLQLLELVTRRLPVLLINDPDLAWMAAPFIRDIEEGRRLVLAYRAINKPVPASLPVALRLGVIDEQMALEELFDVSSGESLDLALLEEVWLLLRHDEARELFRRNLSAYSGVITEDADKDGLPENFAEYSRGMLVKSIYDPAQSGIPDLTIFFEAGLPRRALYLLPPEIRKSRLEAKILWERYPSLEEVELDAARYISRPLHFYFAPVKFVELWGSGVLFPQIDPMNPPLTRRVLVSQSLQVERPSLEFRGGIEVVELNQGIPVRAREFVGDLMVSETDFLRGRPQLQRLDLDFNGRMETFRFFSRNYRQMELEELWDFDREYDRIVTVEE